MEEKIHEINVFVPANAIQHFENPEDASRIDRVRRAVLRWWQKKDFESSLQLNCNTYIILDKVQFDKNRLGYEVFGYIKSV